jgi:hypothetical protein
VAHGQNGLPTVEQTVWLSSNPVNIQASSSVEIHAFAMLLELVSGRQDHGTIWIIRDEIRGEGDGPSTTELFPDEY